jgi:hypothetical protein
VEKRSRWIGAVTLEDLGIENQLCLEIDCSVHPTQVAIDPDSSLVNCDPRRRRRPQKSEISDWLRQTSVLPSVNGSGPLSVARCTYLKIHFCELSTPRAARIAAVHLSERPVEWSRTATSVRAFPIFIQLVVLVPLELVCEHLWASYSPTCSFLKLPRPDSANNAWKRHFHPRTRQPRTTAGSPPISPGTYSPFTFE